MSGLLAIDPGTHFFGVAVFNGSQELQSAWLERRRPERIGYHVDRIVIEIPQVYARGTSKARPKDLVSLAFAAGRATLFAPDAAIYLVVPHAWKGNLEKEQTEERVIAELSADEVLRVQLPARSYAHNVWDAIGIGLKALGRMGLVPAMEKIT